MFLVLIVFPLVALAVGPPEDAISVHLVFSPLTDVFTTVAPAIRTFALNIVDFKVSFVAIAVGPGELSVPLLDTLLVISFKL